jgi:hypothetical protein
VQSAEKGHAWPFFTRPRRRSSGECGMVQTLAWIEKCRAASRTARQFDFR